jgi:hypothetical protein
LNASDNTVTALQKAVSQRRYFAEGAVFDENAKLRKKEGARNL